MNIAVNRCLLSGLLLFTCSLRGQPPSNPASPEREILKLEADWYRAFLQSDSGTMNRIEAPEIRVITPDTTAEQFVSPHPPRDFSRRSDAERAQMAAMQRRLDDTKIRFFGDIAILTGIQTRTMKAEGGVERTHKTFLTSVWVKRNNSWQIVNFQSTLVPEASSRN